MVSHEDVVTFLDRLAADGATYSEVSDGIWNVRPAGALDFGVVVNYSPPVIVLRVKVMDLPAAGSNAPRSSIVCSSSTANDLLHGAYGLQKDEVVLTEALELDHLDFEEFLSAYESITLALASHIRELASFREAR